METFCTTCGDVLEAQNEIQAIKDELIKYMTVRPGQYKIEISPDEWHRIFKTKS